MEGHISAYQWDNYISPLSGVYIINGIDWIHIIIAVMFSCGCLALFAVACVWSFVILWLLKLPRGWLQTSLYYIRRPLLKTLYSKCCTTLLLMPGANLYHAQQVLGTQWIAQFVSGRSHNKPLWDLMPYNIENLQCRPTNCVKCLLLSLEMNTTWEQIVCLVLARIQHGVKYCKDIILIYCGQTIIISLHSCHTLEWVCMLYI